MKVLTINNWRRLDYYEEVLRGLKQNPEIKDYKIINIVDYTKLFSQFEKLDKSSGLDIFTYCSEEHMGCARAKHKAFQMGFGLDKNIDFVINLEDDIVPAASFLHYMEWGNNLFQDDTSIFAIVGWNRTIREKDGEFNKVTVRTPDKTYQAWGIWRRIWSEVRDGWFGIHWNESVFKPEDGADAPHGEEFLKVIKKSDDGSWGWPMKNYWRGSRKVVIPVISRAQNIGATRGRFNFNPDWHRTWIWNSVWAEDRPAPESYNLTAGD